MTKEELRDYCYSIGLIDSKSTAMFGSKYPNGYIYPNEFVNPIDFLAGWDNDKQCVVVAKSCEIIKSFGKNRFTCLALKQFKMMKKLKLALVS